MGLTRRWGAFMGLGLAVTLWLPEASQARDDTEIEKLKRKATEQETLIQQQQATLQQLAAKLATLEAKVEGRPIPPLVETERVGLETEELAALPPEMAQKGPGRLPLEIGGYIDVGYVDAAGGGTVSTGTLHVNSRADTLSSLGLDGDSSFLINEVNVDLKAHVSEFLDAVASFDFLPRTLSFTTSGGTAQTDSMEVDLAYVVCAPPLPEPSPLTDSLFGDLRLWLGKFESPWGIEYRVNESPDRVNISRSMMSVYWTGYPVGIKARGKLLKGLLGEFRNSALTYNLALTNAEPWISTLADVDRAGSKRRTIMGRLSYGLDALGGFAETGVSLASGARINQGDEKTETESLGLDARMEWGPLTLRAEYDDSDLDRPRTGGSAATFSHWYLEGFYELRRPQWLPPRIPWVSLTPYYRYDTRDFNSTPAVGAATTQEVKRHTFALNYRLWPKSILKGEYQLVGEAEEASVNDNAFLMSFVQEF